MNSSSTAQPGQASREQAWSDFWKTGAIHACMGSFDAAYSGSIGQYWSGLFRNVSPAMRVLDLGSGNGALPRLLLEQQAQARIDAVDLAQVHPAWLEAARHPEVRFHAGVMMEHLPFPDASFDLAVSQFGIEYARYPDAFDELARVLKPAGQIALVMHHASGILTRVARQESEHANWLLRESRLFASLQEVLPWVARARAGEAVSRFPEANPARNRYNQTMSRILTRAEQAQVPDLLWQFADWAQQLLATISPQQIALVPQRLNAVQADLEAAVLRSQELIQHALSVQQLAEIEALLRLRFPDSSLSRQTLMHDGEVLAWALNMTHERD